ncbi:hypothetical protein BKA63DRAFT_494249 [Paraphoma chrysanthemicola]|nr:hypothetical protein BKA63DRAFT_494249 [Paraphoma chrysanthemicola]
MRSRAQESPSSRHRKGDNSSSGEDVDPEDSSSDEEPSVRRKRSAKHKSKKPKRAIAKQRAKPKSSRTKCARRDSISSEDSSSEEEQPTRRTKASSGTFSLAWASSSAKAVRSFPREKRRALRKAIEEKAKKLAMDSETSESSDDLNSLAKTSNRNSRHVQRRRRASSSSASAETSSDSGEDDSSSEQTNLALQGEQNKTDAGLCASCNVRQSRRGLEISLAADKIAETELKLTRVNAGMRNTPYIIRQC